MVGMNLLSVKMRKEIRGSFAVTHPDLKSCGCRAWEVLSRDEDIKSVGGRCGHKKVFKLVTTCCTRKH